MNSGFFRPIVEALEIVISALLEFVGIEVGKYFLGEFFIALLLSSIVTVPVAAVLVDTITDNMRVEYGGFGYYLIACLVAAPICFGGATVVFLVLS